MPNPSQDMTGIWHGIPNKTLLYRYPPLFQILQFLGSGFGKEDYLGISCYFLVTVSQDPIPNLQPTESCINWV